MPLASVPYVDAESGFAASVYGIARDPESCKSLIALPASESARGLGTDRIRFMSWNVQKESGRDWRDDFDKLAADQDLVLLQEAAANSYAVQTGNAAPYWSFAQGYNAPSGLTGVMTLSAAPSLAQCHLTEQEPWLRSDKATNITEYALVNSELTLAVVNIHAINFTIGLEAFNDQLLQIAEVIQAHEGPVILSGDMNTWRDGRQKLVDRLAVDLGLKALTFSDDQRSRFFGKHVDQVYVRGLQVLETRTPIVDSSDHNPIMVTLRLI
jgi:endonuclease/exonuclease/phosphatase (EEP) superfamily protein YafD